MKLYHISRRFIGTEVKFWPFKPVSEQKDEVSLPARVCASPTLAQCWDAIACTDVITEMRRKGEGTNGFYFFVYDFESTDNFKANTCVFDFEKTGEHISVCRENAKLISCFYVDRYKMQRTNFDDVAQSATIPEAIEAWEEWQKDMIVQIEAAIEAEK